MVYRLLINKTELIVQINQKGGKTHVFKDSKLYFCGQYFPIRKKLWVPDFGFEEIVKIVEKSINSKIDDGDIVFPYYKAK